MTKFDLTKSLYQILFISILQTYNLRYSRRFWIIKCVGLKPILFSINLDVASSSKVVSSVCHKFVILGILNVFLLSNMYV